MTEISPLQLTVNPLPKETKPEKQFWDGETPSFKDVLDTINPLQHIPVISNIYRAMTGDNAPSTAAQLAGGTLFGGALGFAAAMVNSIVESATGMDIEHNMMAVLHGEANPELAANNDGVAYQPSTRLLAASSYVQAQSLLG